MSNKGNGRRVVGNALIWAAMIIASALLFDGREGGETMMMLLIVGWLASQPLIAGARSAREECVGLRRLYRRNR